MTTQSIDLTFSTENWENLNFIAEAYDSLRQRIYDRMRANDGKLMGRDAWLRFVISESQMTLMVGPAAINVTGTCYSMQSMSNEQFDFFINFEDLAD